MHFWEVAGAVLVAGLLVALALEFADVLFAKVCENLVKFRLHGNDFVVLFVRLLLSFLICSRQLHRISFLSEDKVVQDLVLRLVCRVSLLKLILMREDLADVCCHGFVPRPHWLARLESLLVGLA